MQIRTILVPTDFSTHSLDALAKSVAQAGVACEARVTASRPVDAILELAAALPADLIALGTHGHTGLKHLVLGSSAERIVRLAPCPVLTVKDAKSRELA